MIASYDSVLLVVIDLSYMQQYLVMARIEINNGKLQAESGVL